MESVVVILMDGMGLKRIDTYDLPTRGTGTN